MSSESLFEMPQIPATASSSPDHKSPSPPSSTSLASHLLAAVSQVQSLTSQLPSSVPLPSSSPTAGGPVYRPTFLNPHMAPLQIGGHEPPMSNFLASFKDFPRQYHSPPPLPSSENHECKIVDYRGAKVAAFVINGETMLCLPQAFEMFLKHLVGGLHTVYTKLKRLGIEPVVCNVDQVRILRGLGAIQPGVNRCKLLSMKHFDILYRDCTTASSRPGRPPKRASDFMTMAPTHDVLFDLKKRHLENGGGIAGGAAGAFLNGHPGSDPRMEKSPLLANGYHAPPHFSPLHYMAHHMAGLGYPAILPGALPGALQANMPGGGGHPNPISPTEASSPIKHPHITPEALARFHEERLEKTRQLAMEQVRELTPTSTVAPPQTPNHDDPQPPVSPVLNLSKDVGGDSEKDITSDIRGLQDEETRVREDDRISDMEDIEDETEKDESLSPSAMDTTDFWTRSSSTPGHQNQMIHPIGPHITGTAPLSSTEVLLRNILGLLRVAEENARHHERQTQYEKAELKMEVLRERELRESLEKQLQEEQRNRLVIQKRCIKLKKLRRRLQERLDLEVKRRCRYEDHLRNASPDALNDINDGIRKNMEAIAAEFHQDNMHQLSIENKEVVNRLLTSPSLANHAAAVAIVTSNNTWR